MAKLEEFVKLNFSPILLEKGGFMAGITISSSDFLKSYGQVSEAALKDPVSITSHGRERLVLLSADEYRRLKQYDRKALYPWELDDEALDALAAAEPSTAATRFDPETQ